MCASLHRIFDSNWSRTAEAVDFHGRSCSQPARVSQALAVVEGKRADRSDAAGGDNGHEVGASRERGVANCSDVLVKGDGLEASAGKEHLCYNHTAVDGHRFQAAASIEQLFTDGCYALRNGDRCEFGAPIERTLANGSHTLRNSDRCESGASIESITADGCHTLRNGDRCEFGALPERMTRVG